ncbi:MAG TPA: ABC transporter ATP-binding protein [Firmicutes bacterium]|nr:ABC transporter ATP-binding protein [Bacillota bacterium]
MALLDLKEVTMRFGGLTAVNSFNLNLEKGELVGLIGPNGAGKTTVFNIITGVYRPTAGKVYLADEDITGFRPDVITKRGIARTFQNIRLFGSLTVLDNVLVAQHLRLGASPLEAVLGLGRYWGQEAKMHERALELLAAVELEAVANEQATSLPYGQQRRLEIARALATEPKVLLLDEPAAGMNPAETVDLMDFIQRIRREFGLTILLIEHQMRVVMGICERIIVLDYGQTIAEGPPAVIQRDSKVITAYLGVSADA